MSRKSVAFDPNIPCEPSYMKTPEEEAMIAELSRVLDNTIKKQYQNKRTIKYLNSLKKSSDLLKRLKSILPENVILPNVIEFIIFVIKKYYTGINGLRGMKSNSRKGRSIFLYMIINSGKGRSILLYCLDYLFGINKDLIIILTKMYYYTEDELHSKNKRYSMEKRETFKTCSAADIILLIFFKSNHLLAKNNEYVALYQECLTKKPITLRSDLTMGGLLNLSDENNDKITVEENTVVENTAIVENTLVENTVEEIVKDIVKDIVENTVENTDENTDKNTLVENTSNENKGFVKPTLILVCVVLVLIRSIPFIFK